MGEPQSVCCSSARTAGISISHAAPDVHANMMLGQFSPVATLLIGWSKNKRYSVLEF